MKVILLLLAFAAIVKLLYHRRGYFAFLATILALIVAWKFSGIGSPKLLSLFSLAAILAAALLGVSGLRQQLITRFIKPVLAAALPRMSDTERVALEAGTVWWDGELFSGDPHWQKLFNTIPPKLSDAEQQFLDGPVEELCEMLDAWEVHKQGDLPQEAWDHIKKHRFFGMIIPEEYGGLEFSANAHSKIVTKLATRNLTAMVSIMVPNSLGPAELLLKYGTKEQKDRYLPKLATAEEIPCFALTGPEAGSDAAATKSFGIVCRGTYEGREVLGMRLTWNKRYITLAPIATTIGLAFKLKDPDKLLGDEEDLGITCALVPRHLEGVKIGERHDPLGAPFHNGPTYGKDVFVPLDFIIGGKEMAGQGWRMLMECLSVGRSISLPSMAVGLAQLATRATSAYGIVREQFNTPIGRFEGVEEKLARIFGFTYFMNATRNLTISAVDAGENPSVVSAIVKAYLTENMREIINDAMDILAGAAISQGPRNIFAAPYSAVPVGITVEGANILTRTLIIYGQGALRCHPFVREEMESAVASDLERFDRAFFGHINFVFANAARAFTFALGHDLFGARFGASLPRETLTTLNREVKSYLHKLTRFSSAFSTASDMAMGSLGAELKRREKISGRLADALSWLYIVSATIKQYVENGQPEKERHLFRWACDYGLYQIQSALKGAINNLPLRVAAWKLKGTIFPLGTRLKPPSDALGGKVVDGILHDQPLRNALTKDIFHPQADEVGLGRLETAYQQCLEALAVKQKVKRAIRKKQLEKGDVEDLLAQAADKGIITKEEKVLVEKAESLRDDVIQVDAFAPESFR